MSLEMNPILQQGPEFDFRHREQPKAQFKTRFSSPFLPDSFVFSSRAKELGIHPSTAAILDDMQFLVSTVLDLSEAPSDQELKKLQSTATWIYDRISNLPMNLAETSSETPTQGEDAAMTEPRSGRPGVEDPILNPESSFKPHSLLPKYPEFTASAAPSSTAHSTDDTRAETPTSAVTETLPRATAPPNTQLQVITETETPVESQTTEVGANPSGKDPAPPSNRPSSPSPGQKPAKDGTNADPLYTAVRLAAPLYAHAIATRQPFSKICKPLDALRVLAATWRIPLSQWRGVIGPLLFTLISIIATVSGAHDQDGQDDEDILSQLRPHAGFVKSILQIGFMQIALEDWEVCRETMDSALRLLEWLRGPSADIVGKDEAQVGGSDREKTRN